MNTNNIAVVGADRIMRSGWVLLCKVAGPGVNFRLHEAQRSWTISSFFLRVPLRVTLRLPQCGHASGCLEVQGVRAMRGMKAILAKNVSPYHAGLESARTAFWM
jgi:hypothetical protein